VSSIPQQPISSLPHSPIAFEADGPVYYPTSDGRPMAETDLHRDEIVDGIETLRMFFAGQRVYVSGNILLYYKPGNKRRHVSPDLLVAKGLSPTRRDYYLLWEEGKPPDVVVEYTSESTQQEDIEGKFAIYRDQVKVPEYFLFDPRAEYLNPPLQGFRLVGGDYVRIEPVEGRLPSEQLGLHLQRRGNELRFYDPATGKVLPTLKEAHEQAEAAREQAEAEVKRLRRELEKQRRKKK
jgi:hypothetical protein